MPPRLYESVLRTFAHRSVVWLGWVWYSRAPRMQTKGLPVAGCALVLYTPVGFGSNAVRKSPFAPCRLIAGGKSFQSSQPRRTRRIVLNRAVQEASVTGYSS